MKLVLSSIGIDQAVAEQIDKSIKKDRNKIKIAIIVDAKKYRPKEDFEKSITENTQYVRDLGFNNISHFSIQEISTDELLDNLTKFDVVYIFGGNTFYLLDNIRKHNFNDTLKKLARDGKFIVGQSAGSIIFSPSVEIAQNDFASDDNFIDLKNLDGLNLVNFAVFPHYHESFKKNIQGLRQNTDYDIYAIKNGSAIFVDDGEIIYLGEKPEIFKKN